MLNYDDIKKNLQIPEEINLQVFNSINSTNDYLKNISGASKMQVCLAEEQTAGRGRGGKNWHSPRGKNIYMSLLFLEMDLWR